MDAEGYKGLGRRERQRLIRRWKAEGQALPQGLGALVEHPRRRRREGLD